MFEGVRVCAPGAVAPTAVVVRRLRPFGCLRRARRGAARRGRGGASDGQEEGGGKGLETVIRSCTIYFSRPKRRRRTGGEKRRKSVRRGGFCGRFGRGGGEFFWLCKRLVVSVCVEKVGRWVKKNVASSEKGRTFAPAFDRGSIARMGY